MAPTTIVGGGQPVLPPNELMVRPDSIQILWLRDKSRTGLGRLSISKSLFPLVYGLIAAHTKRRYAEEGETPVS